MYSPITCINSCTIVSALSLEILGRISQTGMRESKTRIRPSIE